ncbi:hypothetical protein LEP1GSC087_4190 [Leptospira interrogans serovar Bataviae str. L1111]|nr:hypothetical protein LEP1GSC087_4190 [Leptospira interrogans serovar Bataviae str. L1111]
MNIGSFFCETQSYFPELNTLALCRSFEKHLLKGQRLGFGASSKQSL